MKPLLYDRIFHRELGYHPRNIGLKALYGSPTWIDELDIVNELGGHTGCVNALRYANWILSNPPNVLLTTSTTDGRIPAAS